MLKSGALQGLAIASTKPCSHARVKRAFSSSSRRYRSYAATWYRWILTLRFSSFSGSAISAPWSSSPKTRACSSRNRETQLAPARPQRAADSPLQKHVPVDFRNDGSTRHPGNPRKLSWLTPREVPGLGENRRARRTRWLSEGAILHKWNNNKSKKKTVFVPTVYRCHGLGHTNGKREIKSKNLTFQFPRENWLHPRFTPHFYTENF